MTIFDVMLNYDLQIANVELWHPITPPLRGEINGIPTFRGVIVAASGHLGLMLCDDGRKVDVHLSSFVRDIDQPERLEHGRSEQTERVKLTANDLAVKYGII